MSRERDPIWQTHAPHVEFYIVVPSGSASGSGRTKFDILRDERGRPRTLLSFSHVVMGNGDGPFRIEVFDPSFVQIEELLLSYNQVPWEGGWENSGLTEEQLQILNSCVFRYGYVSQDGKVLSTSPHGELYFSGVITSYTPTLQANGTNLVIEGQTNSQFRKIRIDSSWYSKPLYTVLKDICLEMDWELRGLGADQLQELPLPKQPEVLLDPGQSLDSTEETPRTIKIGGSEMPYHLVQRICQYARSVDPKFGPYTTRLQYYTSDILDNPKGYLYFGPRDVTQDPVRRYVFMRDKRSEVISFSPTVHGTVGAMVGQAGMIAMVDDARHGEISIQQRSEMDRQMVTHNKERPKVNTRKPQDGIRQQGTPQLKGDDVQRVEGTTHGTQSLAPAHKIPPDNPAKEMALRVDNRYFGDREGMNYWLTAQNMSDQATLVVFGDPGGSADTLDVGKLVDVFIFVPREDNTFKLHYLSNRWVIDGVVHQIAGGSYTTTLELSKTGFNLGGTTTEAQTITLLQDSLDAALGSRMRKLVR